jgi:hypothetical protein
LALILLVTPDVMVMIPAPPAALGLKLKPAPPLHKPPNRFELKPLNTVVRRWFGSNASPPAAAVRTVGPPAGASGQTEAVPFVSATLVTRAGVEPWLARRK